MKMTDLDDTNPGFSAHEAPKQNVLEDILREVQETRRYCQTACDAALDAISRIPKIEAEIETIKRFHFWFPITLAVAWFPIAAGIALTLKLWLS